MTQEHDGFQRDGGHNTRRLLWLFRTEAAATVAGRDAGCGGASFMADTGGYA